MLAAEAEFAVGGCVPVLWAKKVVDEKVVQCVRVLARLGLDRRGS